MASLESIHKKPRDHQLPKIFKLILLAVSVAIKFIGHLIVKGS